MLELVRTLAGSETTIERINQAPFLRLRNRLGLGALIITHDLGLAWNIADRVLVMHRGRIVESGPVEQVLLDPSDDYTRTLLSVVPSRALGEA